jgi:hypothetical protein
MCGRAKTERARGPVALVSRGILEGYVLRIVLIRRIRDSERTSASTNGLRPRCIAGPKYLRKSEDRSKVGNDFVERSESKSEVRKSEVGGYRIGGSGCRRVGGDLDKRRLRVSSLY